MTTISNLGTVDSARPNLSSPAARPGGRPWLDRIGVGASLACAVHCMAAPLLLLALPAAGSIWAHPLVHWVLAVLVLPLALWVIYCGYRKHGKRLTLVAAGLGALLITAGLILPMTNTGWAVSTSVPQWLGGGGVVAAVPEGAAAPKVAGTTCTEACCPSVATDAHTGEHTLVMPAGGLTTMLGSFFLVFAHATNLLAFRGLSNKTGAAGRSGPGCGCPSNAC